MRKSKGAAKSARAATARKGRGSVERKSVRRVQAVATQTASNSSVESEARPISRKAGARGAANAMVKAKRSAREKSKTAAASKRGLVGEGHRIAVLDRAASLLFGLAQSPHPISLNEAARKSGLSKATAFRILSTLTEEGFAVQDGANSSYNLGVMPLRLATSVLDSFPIQPLARQAMRSVCGELNETTVLSVIDGDSRVSIDAVECSNAIGSSRRIGEPRPLHVGASGRVLLSGMTDDGISAYIDRAVRAGGMSRSAQSRVWEEVRRTRRTGFASSAAEISPAVHAVATAIKGPDGATLAALHVSIPMGRFSPRIEAKCRRVLARAARDIVRDISAN